MYAAIEPMLQPGEQTKIWTADDLKAQTPPTSEAPRPVTASPFDTGRDAGTIVAGRKPAANGGNPWEKPAAPAANPWEKPAGQPNSPFGATVAVEKKKKSKEQKPAVTAGANNGSKKGLLIGICAAVVIVGGVLAVLFMGDKSDDAVDSEAIAEVTEVEAPTETVAQDVAEVVEQPVEEADQAAEDQAATEAAATEQTATEQAATVEQPSKPAAQPAVEQPAAPAPKPQDAPKPQAKTRSVLGGKATYDPAARTITFSAPYNMRVGDNAMSIPAGAVLKKVATHPNGNLRSCVLVANGREERLDGLNVAL